VKKELASLDVRVLARELSAALAGGYLDKAYQPSYDELVLTVSGGGAPRRRLHIHIGKYVCLTSAEREMPQSPSQYAMILRKHVSGARIVAVEQHGFDRIIVLHLHVRDEPYRLVCELFRNGTVILVHRDEIVRPVTSRTWGTRDVKAGRDFQMPPPRMDPASLDFEGFKALVHASDADVVRTLASKLGLGGEYAEGLATMSHLPEDRVAAALDLEELGLLFENLQVLFRMADAEPRPRIVKRGGEPLTVLPVELPMSEGDVVEPFPTFNDAVEAFFAQTMVEEERPDVVSEEFTGHVQRLQHQADSQERSVAEREVEVTSSLAMGDLIYANYKLVEGALRSVIEWKEEVGWEEAQKRTAALPGVTSIDPSEGHLTLALPDGEGGTRDVRVTLNLTVVENAELWYERAKRAREKVAGARTALEETRGMLEAAKRGLAEAREDHAEAEDAARERAERGRRRVLWFEKFRWLITSDGTIVVAGRDASSNERVVKRYLRDRDRYCHADFPGAPSTVVKDPGTGVSDQALAEACNMAVIYSKAWSGGRSSADAYWVMPEQVSKTAESGEFVPKGGFIIRGRRNYLKGLEMRMGVGAVDHEGTKLVMGGPVASLQARAAEWVELVPSNDSKEAAAKEVARLLGAELDDVVKVLPPGGCRVVARHGLEGKGSPPH
jgi:predicted ribosome quality control (RQC) complex YloA/Tae2 family protein